MTPVERLLHFKVSIILWTTAAIICSISAFPIWGEEDEYSFVCFDLSFGRGHCSSPDSSCTVESECFALKLLQNNELPFTFRVVSICQAIAIFVGFLVLSLFLIDIKVKKESNPQFAMDVFILLMIACVCQVITLILTSESSETICANYVNNYYDKSFQVFLDCQKEAIHYQSGAIFSIFGCTFYGIAATLTVFYFYVRHRARRKEVAAVHHLLLILIQLASGCSACLFFCIGRSDFDGINLIGSVSATFFGLIATLVCLRIKSEERRNKLTLLLLFLAAGSLGIPSLIDSSSKPSAHDKEDCWKSSWPNENGPCERNIMFNFIGISFICCGGAFFTLAILLTCLSTFMEQRHASLDDDDTVFTIESDVTVSDNDSAIIAIDEEIEEDELEAELTKVRLNPVKDSEQVTVPEGQD